MWCLIISQSWTPWRSSNQTWLKRLQSGSGNAAATGTSTRRERPNRLPPLSPSLSARPRACRLWLMTSVFLKPPTRVGSVGWVSSLLCLVYIILFISLTNPAVECMHVCALAHVRTHAGRGFSMPSVVQVCVMKSGVVFWKPSEFQSFSHLRFFLSAPSLLLLPLTHMCSHGTVRPRLLTA